MKHHLIVAVLIVLTISTVGLWTLHGDSVPAAQAAPTHLDTLGGTIAFVGSDAFATRVYLLDVATGQLGRIETQVEPEADIAWQPDGDMLAFTTTEGNYGILEGFTGCFSGLNACEDVTLFEPETPVLGMEWSPDGAWLFLVHADSIAAVPPKATALSVTLTMNTTCGNGLTVVGSTLAGEEDAVNLLCAMPEGDRSVVNVVTLGETAGTDITLVPVRDVGTHTTLTAMTMDGAGHVALGTSEPGGESGWVASPGSAPQRIQANQIHMYGLAFASEQLAVAGAIADSTGDATLADGDMGELFVYDFVTAALTQIPGFTGATGVAGVADDETILVVLNRQSFAFYTPSTLTITPILALLPQPDTEIFAVEWRFGAGMLPPVPAATPVGPATAVPLPTTPPVFTPFPTFTPFVVPTATTGSPVGTGCDFAYSGGGGLPVAIGDTAEVTGIAGGLRVRSGAGLGYAQLRELPAGTRMTVLSGPQCADGYRWWQVQLADGTIGWVADSDASGWWITIATPESISFWADRYSITSGECVTLQWALEGILEVYYLGDGSLNEGVTGAGSRPECPTTTTTYSLRVVKSDGTIETPAVTITVGSAAMPDLFVSEFSLDPATPTKGQAVNVRVGVYNQGSASVSGTSFHIEWYPGENYPSPACTWDLTDMAAGGGRILTCTYAGYPSQYPSINTLVKVDTNNTVTESNELNNAYSEAVTVNDSGGGGGQPDLYVSEFSLDPATPIKGQSVNVRVGVYNQGNASVSSTSFHIEWYPGENYPSPACSWDLTDMAAHGGRILTCTYSGYPSHYPSINTMVKVDTSNTVSESNEGNNVYTQAITVTSP